MSKFGACPRCHQTISNERKSLNPIVCDHCGDTTPNTSDVVQERIETNVIVTMVGLGALIIAGYIQLMNWDRYSLSIIPLSLKEIAGSTSPSDWEAKAAMCLELKKYDCVETQYAKAAQFAPIEYARLGKFQMQRENFAAAAKSFNSYFNNGGDDLEVAYQHAKALGQTEQVDEAVKYFEKVLGARPDILQVTVVNNYVKLLMNHQRYAEAKTLIENVRKQGDSAGSFMEAEMQQIQAITTASR